MENSINFQNEFVRKKNSQNFNSATLNIELLLLFIENTKLFFSCGFSLILRYNYTFKLLSTVFQTRTERKKQKATKNIGFDDKKILMLPKIPK